MVQASADMEENGGAARTAYSGRDNSAGHPPRIAQAIALVCGRDYAGALDACSWTTEQESEIGAVHVVRGLALHGLGRHADALGEFDKAAGLDPRCDMACAGRARALVRLGRPDEAMELFHDAAKINPSSASIHADLAITAVRLGCYDDAIDMCRDAVHLSPGDGEVHAGLAFALAGLGRLDDAWASCKRATEASPMSSRPRAARGRILAGIGRYADALAAFDEAVRLDPASASAHSGRGIALAGIGRYADALAAFDEAVRLDPASASAHSGRGIVLKHMGRRDEAAVAFERAIGIDRHHEMAAAGRRCLEPGGGAGAVTTEADAAIDQREGVMSAAVLGRAIESDYRTGFDHAGREMESDLMDITGRGPRVRGRVGTVAQGGCGDSPPLTPEEWADVREAFAEIGMTEGVREGKLIRSAAKDEDMEDSMLGNPIAAHSILLRNRKRGGTS